MSRIPLGPLITTRSPDQPTPSRHYAAPKNSHYAAPSPPYGYSPTHSISPFAAASSPDYLQPKLTYPSPPPTPRGYTHPVRQPNILDATATVDAFRELLDAYNLFYMLVYADNNINTRATLHRVVDMVDPWLIHDDAYQRVIRQEGVHLLDISKGIEALLRERSRMRPRGLELVTEGEIQRSYRRRSSGWSSSSSTGSWGRRRYSPS